jgi:hypothetical protein
MNVKQNELSIMQCEGVFTKPMLHNGHLEPYPILAKSRTHHKSFV